MTGNMSSRRWTRRRVESGEPFRPLPVSTHEWNRWIWGWHGAFWVFAALSVVWLALTPELPGRSRWLGFCSLGLLMAAYALLVQRSTWRVTWRTDVYLAVAVAAVGITCSIDDTLTLLLFLAYTQAWTLTRSLWHGTGVAVAVTVSASLGLMARHGFTVASLEAVIPQMTAGLLFSVLLGLWISRIIDQSVERAELIAELEATRGELTEAERARGAMAERERMAREIHHTLAQGFTSIIMLSQAAAAGLVKHPERAGERLATIEDVARQNLAEARALVAAFSPVDLEGSTLPDAVRRLTERFAAETGLVVDLDVPESTAHLSRDREVVLLRAVQESLTNVRRHAAARQVVVRLYVDRDGARVEVGDDGVGFSRTEAEGGYGLAGMRGRVAEVGGELDVASVPGGGTRVTVKVPVGTGEEATGT